MTLRWARRAQRDLIEIARFIAADDPAAARRFVELLRKRARAAAAMPGTGRKVPEIGREEIREAIFRGYRIVYLVRARAIVVLTVLEGHRLLPRGAVKG